MLRLEVAVEPPAAPAGVAVIARIRLINAGDRDLVVNGRLAWNVPSAPPRVRDLTFRIDGPPQESVIAVNVRMGDPRAEDFAALAAGEAIAKEIEVTRYVALDTPGTYAITALYTNVHRGPGPEPAWTGELQSRPVHFERTA